MILTGNASQTIPSVVGAESGHRPFNVGEGNSAQLCIKAVQTSSEKGTRESSPQCANATAPVYARNSSGYQGGEGVCKYGPCGSGTHYMQGVELSGWPPNATVNCSGKWAGKDARVTLQVDGNGYWKGIPYWYWDGKKIYLTSADSKDFNGWFTCQQQ